LLCRKKLGTLEEVVLRPALTADVMFKFTMIVMRFAPFGIGAPCGDRGGRAAWEASHLGKMIYFIRRFGGVFFLVCCCQSPDCFKVRFAVSTGNKRCRSPADCVLDHLFRGGAAMAMPSMESDRRFRGEIVAFVMPTGY